MANPYSFFHSCVNVGTSGSNFFQKLDGDNETHVDIQFNSPISRLSSAPVKTQTALNENILLKKRFNGYPEGIENKNLIASCYGEGKCFVGFVASEHSSLYYPHKGNKEVKSRRDRNDTMKRIPIQIISFQLADAHRFQYELTIPFMTKAYVIPQSNRLREDGKENEIDSIAITYLANYDPALFGPVVPVTQKSSAVKKSKYRRKEKKSDKNTSAEWKKENTHFNGNDAVLVSVFFEGVVQYYLAKKSGLFQLFANDKLLGSLCKFNRTPENEALASAIELRSYNTFMQRKSRRVAKLKPRLEKAAGGNSSDSSDSDNAKAAAKKRLKAELKLVQGWDWTTSDEYTNVQKDIRRELNLNRHALLPSRGSLPKLVLSQVNPHLVSMPSAIVELLLVFKYKSGRMVTMTKSQSFDAEQQTEFILSDEEIDPALDSHYIGHKFSVDMKNNPEDENKQSKYLFACWGSHYATVLHSNGQTIYSTDIRDPQNPVTTTLFNLPRYEPIMAICANYDFDPTITPEHLRPAERPENDLELRREQEEREKEFKERERREADESSDEAVVEQQNNVEPSVQDGDAVVQQAQEERQVPVAENAQEEEFAIDEELLKMMEEETGLDDNDDDDGDAEEKSDVGEGSPMPPRTSQLGLYAVLTKNFVFLMHESSRFPLVQWAHGCVGIPPNTISFVTSRNAQTKNDYLLVVNNVLGEAQLYHYTKYVENQTFDDFQPVTTSASFIPLPTIYNLSLFVNPPEMPAFVESHLDSNSIAVTDEPNEKSTGKEKARARFDSEMLNLEDVLDNVKVEVIPDEDIGTNKKKSRRGKNFSGVEDVGMASEDEENSAAWDDQNLEATLNRLLQSQTFGVSNTNSRSTAKQDDSKKKTLKGRINESKSGMEHGIDDDDKKEERKEVKKEKKKLKSEKETPASNNSNRDNNFGTLEVEEMEVDNLALVLDEMHQADGSLSGDDIGDEGLDIEFVGNMQQSEHSEGEIEETCESGKKKKRKKKSKKGNSELEGESEKKARKKKKKSKKSRTADSDSVGVNSAGDGESENRKEMKRRNKKKKKKKKDKSKRKKKKQRKREGKDTSVEHDETAMNVEPNDGADDAGQSIPAFDLAENSDDELEVAAKHEPEMNSDGDGVSSGSDEIEAEVKRVPKGPPFTRDVRMAYIPKRVRKFMYGATVVPNVISFQDLRCANNDDENDTPLLSSLQPHATFLYLHCNIFHDVYVQEFSVFESGAKDHLRPVERAERDTDVCGSCRKRFVSGADWNSLFGIESSEAVTVDRIELSLNNSVNLSICEECRFTLNGQSLWLYGDKRNAVTECARMLLSNDPSRAGRMREKLCQTFGHNRYFKTKISTMRTACDEFYRAFTAAAMRNPLDTLLGQYAFEDFSDFCSRLKQFLTAWHTIDEISYFFIIHGWSINDDWWEILKEKFNIDIQQKQSLSFGYIYSIRETAEELEKPDLVKISTDAEIDLLQCMHRGTKVVQALHKALDRKKRAENAEFMMDEQDAKPQKKSKYKFPRRAVLADFDPASTDGTQNLAIAEASEFQSRWAQLKAENGL